MNSTNSEIESRLEELLRKVEEKDSVVVSQSCEDEDMRADLKDMRDVRAALLKKNVGEVNVDEAWLKFKKGHSKSSPSVSVPPQVSESKFRNVNRKWMWVVSGVAMGIAATILLVILLYPLWIGRVESERILAFTAIEQSNNVELTAKTIDEVSQGAPIYKPKVLNVFVKEDTIDFRKVNEDLNPVYKQRVIRTPRGKDFRVILSDGSEVILNADSKLIFPLKFKGNNRLVYLEGEAYFKIAKDKEHPFIVKSKNYSTTALGTEFNVKAYSNDVHITLIEGSVSVEDEQCNENVILEPGQDVSTVDDRMVVSEVNIKSYIQWKEGYFYFDDVPLVDILTELGRWYNVNIELTSRSLMAYRLHFVADRSAKIDDALERLNEFSYLSAKMEGNRIVISKK